MVDQAPEKMTGSIKGYKHHTDQKIGRRYPQIQADPFFIDLNASCLLHYH